MKLTTISVSHLYPPLASEIPGGQTQIGGGGKDQALKTEGGVKIKHRRQSIISFRFSRHSRTGKPRPAEKWDPKMDPFWGGQNGENTRKQRVLALFRLKRGSILDPFLDPIFRSLIRIYRISDCVWTVQSVVGGWLRARCVGSLRGSLTGSLSCRAEK